MPPPSIASTSQPIELPPLAVLTAWVARPRAVAQCCIADIYALCVLQEIGGGKPGKRDVYALNRFPCNIVEVVAWVAGVDHKERSIHLTLDDGDGRCVLTAVIWLAESKPGTAPPGPAPAHASKPAPPASTGYKTRAQRLADRSQAQAGADARVKVAVPKQAEGGKTYVRPDVRVGDTVRVRGKVEDWYRARRDGSGDGEWIRQFTVKDDGMIAVVDQDEQSLMSNTLATVNMTCKSSVSIPSHTNSSYADSLGVEPSSVSTIMDDAPELRDPDRLRSSQLTLRTFELYLCEHMQRSLLRQLRADPRTPIEPSTKPIPALQSLFPEYGALTRPLTTLKRPSKFADSTRDNALTPTPARYRTKKQREADAATAPTAPASRMIRPFTPRTILADPTMARLAARIVEQEARAKEKARRARMADGTASAVDREVERARVATGSRKGEWRPTPGSSARKAGRLVDHAIRNVAARTTALVAVPDDGGSGYIPIFPDVLVPLLVALLAADRESKRGVFVRKGERGGMTAEAVCQRLRGWGEDGRWERVALDVVIESLEHAEAQGLLRRTRAERNEDERWSVAE
ncbi:hypothetical protein Q5752_002737 [Cryptotrichosporon argae]